MSARDNPTLSVEGLTVVRGGRRILDGAAFAVPRDTVVGIIGPNGAGKSTLLSCLYRHIEYTEGEVRIDGRELRSVPRKELARMIAAVPQDTQIAFDLTVEEIVAAGRIPYANAVGIGQKRDRQIIDQSLQQVNLEHLRHRSAATLSGGERQRAFLGRALAQSAPILILDEPTNHLDLANQEQLLDMLRHHWGTTLVAIHDLNLALEYCDIVVVLDQGRVVVSGPPSEIVSPELLMDVFGVRCHIVPHPESHRPHIIGRGRRVN